ncbi:hypothetical protein D3C76_1790110 [compost metagenome]
MFIPGHVPSFRHDVAVHCCGPLDALHKGDQLLRSAESDRLDEIGTGILPSRPALKSGPFKQGRGKNAAFHGLSH